MANESKLREALVPAIGHAHVDHAAGVRCVDATVEHVLRVLREWPDAEEVARLGTWDPPMPAREPGDEADEHSRSGK